MLGKKILHLRKDLDVEQASEIGGDEPCASAARLPSRRFGDRQLVRRLHL
jgi:hypothetical protein